MSKLRLFLAFLLGFAITGSAMATVVGFEGIDAWQQLSGAEKNRLLTEIQSFFLHQSVGGDLEDGAEEIGFKFEYADSSATSLSPGLNGGLFSSSNGDPIGKIAEFRAMALANAQTVHVAIMKFGYADILEGQLEDVQSAYSAAVHDIKAAGVKVLHITPPFVYAVPEENAPKMDMRNWIAATFPDDVLFDLQDVESTEPSNGARCERGGFWEICDSVRSTEGCPSKNQGVDAPSGQGHICFDPHAQRFAKAFLYAIYLTETGSPPSVQTPAGVSPALAASLIFLAFSRKKRISNCSKLQSDVA